jgi:hypothetical protein
VDLTIKRQEGSTSGIDVATIARIEKIAERLCFDVPSVARPGAQAR